MELVKKDQNFQCSILTSDQTHEMFERFAVAKGDFERKRVDFPLLDAFVEILDNANQPKLKEELRKSVKKKNGITKQFYHHHQTFENLSHFLDKTFDRKPYRWNVNYKVALRIIEEMLCIPREKLSPTKIQLSSDMYKVWSNKKASAGAIGVGTKQEQEENIFIAFKKIKEGVINQLSYDSMQIPAYPFHRAQISGYAENGKLTGTVKLKDRLVWGLDGATVTFEGQYAKPFIQHCISRFYSYVGGDEPDIIRSKIRHAFVQSGFWYGIDFSKFDQTIQSWLIKDVFEIIKKFFSSDYYAELDYICYNFIHTKIITPGGRVEQKHRGIPSGSNFTQIVGSICNGIMILTYLASRYDGNENEKYSYVLREIVCGENMFGMFLMGDDNLLFVRHEIDIDNLSKYVDRVFGVKIHPDKTETSRNFKFPIFLKREWRPRGEYREALDLMVNVIHPERDRSYDGYSPWHIVYGLFLTYRETFRDLTNELFLLGKIRNFGGVEPFEKLDYSELPGSLKSFGYNRVPFLLEHVKAMLKIAS